MPRGARKDVAVTKLLFQNGILRDRRSFVSLNANEPHLFLKGEDVVRARNVLLAKKKFICESCKRLLPIGEEEMDHRQGGLVGRCDCQHNLRILCHDCHRTKHVQTRFSNTGSPSGQGG